MIKKDLIRLICDEKDEHRWTHQYRFVVRKCDTCPVNAFLVIFFLLPHENVLQGENNLQWNINPGQKLEKTIKIIVLNIPCIWL